MLYSQPTLTAFPVAFPWQFTLLKALLVCPNPLHPLTSFQTNFHLYLMLCVSFFIYFFFGPAPEDLGLQTIFSMLVFKLFIVLTVLPLFSVLLSSLFSPLPLCIPLYVQAHAAWKLSQDLLPLKQWENTVCRSICHFNIVNNSSPPSTVLHLQTADCWD